jgi:hypothetical protein
MRPASGRRGRIGAAILASAGLLGGSPAQVQGPVPPRPPAPGPACQAHADPADVAAVEALIERLRERAAAPGADVVQTLDNRGYAYGPAPHPFTQIPVPDQR